MILRFASGSLIPRKAPRNCSPASTWIERNVVVPAKQTHDLFCLAKAQQAVVDENASQPVADRFMDQAAPRPPN